MRRPARNIAKRRNAKNGSSANEIFGDVCFNLLRDDMRKLRLYDASRGTKLSSWIGMIATNVAYDYLRGTAREIQTVLETRSAVKGEITLLIAKPESREPKAESPRVSVAQRVREIMASDQLDEKSALKKAAKERGIGKSEAYREFQRSK